MSSPSFPISSGGGSGEGTSDHSLLTNRDAADQHPAASITPVTTNFDGNLSSADDTVQKALETLDAMTGGGDTLPIADTTAIVKDPVDATKLVRIDAGTVGTGQTRVITMPNQDVDLTPGTGTYPAASHAHGNVTDAGLIGTTANLPIITGTGGVLQAGAFGTGATNFCVGNDSRLSDARTPSSHTHGNITNAGAIGTTTALPIITTTDGVLTAGSFGTDAGTFCQGNDGRLSNARTPSAHNLIDTTGHPVTGLTTGHFLKATGATSYGFGAHGLTASDVGAQPVDDELTSLAGLSLTGNGGKSITVKSDVSGFELTTISGALDIVGLTGESAAVASDQFPFYDATASANRKITLSELQTALGIAGSTDHWIAESGSFTATPVSTSTLTMTSDRTGTIKAGYGVRYTIGGTVYYGVITAMASNLMTIAGASLSGDVTALSYTKTGVVQMPILIPGYYEDATSAALLAEDLGQTLLWQQGPAYLVRALMYSRVVDSSSDGYANVRQGAAVISGTAQAGDGTHITLAAAGSSGDDDAYNNMWIKITGGTGSGQSRKITDYVGSTKVAQVATWATNPSSDSTYEIYKPVINSNTYSGLLLDTTAAKTTVIDIDTTKYAISYGDTISVMALKGTGGTALDLSVMLTYVVA